MSDRIALLDGDILSYEIGFASEYSWRKKAEERGEEVTLPSVEYAFDLLDRRVADICYAAGANPNPQVYITGNGNFRFLMAQTTPYKERDHGKRPAHYQALRDYMCAKYSAEVVVGMEADDYICVEQRAAMDKGIETIICTRDKDLRMMEGWHYGWEVGRQPSFGPERVTEMGYLRKEGKKVKGTGLSFFYFQLITGDTVDSIPGCPGYGPIKAFKILDGLTTAAQMEKAVKTLYKAVYKDGWEEVMLEQGRLLWMVQYLDEMDCPIHWQMMP